MKHLSIHKTPMKTPHHPDPIAENSSTYTPVATNDTRKGAVAFTSKAVHRKVHNTVDPSVTSNAPINDQGEICPPFSLRHKIFICTREDPTQRSGTECSRTCHKTSPFEEETYNSLELNLLD
eukprot:scaffold46518_cov80-Attheya_sp.AAC.2